MNIKGPKGRGAYSAIVYKDGDMYVAEDDVGTVFKENADAVTTIQQALDDYAVHGLVLVKPDVTFSTPLKILNATSRIEFLGKISLANAINGIEIGDTTHDASGAEIKFRTLDGVNKSGHGIVLKHTSVCQIFFKSIENCGIGMYFDACTGGHAYENVIEGAVISTCGTAGVRFSSSILNMEGNHFQSTIFNSPIGFDLVSGGFSTYQTFIGVIDCIDHANSEDIKDAVGKQLFILDYVRPETCTIKANTTLLHAHGVDYGGSILEMQHGSANLQNIGFQPLLIWDFNRDSTGDWTKYQCTMGTPAKSVTRLTASDTDPSISRDITVDGGQAQVIIIRYKFISGTAAESKMFYKTSGHGYSESYYYKLSKCIADSNWHIQVLDMSDLTAGGTDWVDNTITGIKYDFLDPAVAASVLDIDFIAIGTRAYASIYNIDDAMKTPASSGAAGNKGDIRWDTGYIYICTAKDTWERVAIATW